MIKDILFIRTQGKYEQIELASIVYVLVKDQHLYIVTRDKTFLTLNTLKDLEKYLPKYQFCRVHRSYIVAVRQIAGFDNSTIFLKNTTEIPLAYKCREELISSINILTRELPSRSTGRKTVRQLQQRSKGN